MSDLSRLVKEIGIEVQQLSSQVELEKNNISHLQQKLISLTQEAESQKKFKQHLEEELRNLEETYFQPDDYSCGLSDVSEVINEQIRCLNVILSEIMSSNERIRKERIDFILEYKQKLDDYNRHIAQNEKLHAFIELWKVKCTENFKLTAIPDVIREIAEEISSSYNVSIVETLKNALSASAVESEETRISSPQNVCIAEKKEIPAIIPKTQSNTTSDEQLNLSCDIDTQFQQCNVLDASRLRVSALDTSVISSLVKKESYSFPLKNYEQSDTQRDCTMNMDVTICGENDASSY
uniref:EB1 C-terminal domain-containing protein n=1 Tax=Schistosoma mansoni TaxID=6183 RepID=A0A3Q0KLF4_SCHMA